MKKEMIVVSIVVYNKKIEESITYKRVKNISRPNIRILVVDNSEIDFGNKEYCKENVIEYISMCGNKGLSKAYNVVIENCKQQNIDVIVLSDDDTEITEEYFDELDKALFDKATTDIFAPIIYGQDGVIYSPNEFNFVKNHFISSPEQEVSQERFNAIASCLAIRMRVFDDYLFNELLFIDQVDQFFFCEQRKRGKIFGKLDVKIQQNFYQRGSTLTYDAGWKRLRLRIVDIIRHARLMGDKKYLALGYIKCCGLGIQIGKKTKSPSIWIKSVGLATKALIYRL
ncbi:glycosyltransferase [Clostridium botulinum]|uniref:glycosyltransferase n=1 Tax=Clostridium botulinum TaxID=1491 RepID=UPI001FAEC466|nr:glycosyltransferase [Clostridium botulinum]